MIFNHEEIIITSWQREANTIKYLLDHNYGYEDLTVRELRQIGNIASESVFLEDELYAVQEMAEELKKIQPANPLDYGPISPWTVAVDAPVLDNGQKMLRPHGKKLSFIEMMDQMREDRAHSWNGTMYDSDTDDEVMMYLFRNNADSDNSDTHFEVRMYPDHLEYQVPHHPGYEGIVRWLESFDKRLKQRHD